MNGGKQTSVNVKNNVEEELNNNLWDQAANRVRKLKFIAKLKHEIELAEDKLLG